MPARRGVFGTMRQNDPTFGTVHDRAKIAAALNLAVDDLDPDLPIQTVSTGMAFCIVPLRSLEVAARLAIPQPAARAYLEQSDAKFFHCITRADASSGADWHARMQFYNGEDPATGSASGCTIAYLVRHGLAASDQHIVLEQGIEMLRPSRIHVQASLHNGSRAKCVRRRPHHSGCKRTLFPAVMHEISTATHYEIANVHAAFTFIGGCASSNTSAFRRRFAVANFGNHSYSWQALKTALP